MMLNSNMEKWQMTTKNTTVMIVRVNMVIFFHSDMTTQQQETHPEQFL